MLFVYFTPTDTIPTAPKSRVGVAYEIWGRGEIYQVKPCAATTATLAVIRAGSRVGASITTACCRPTEPLQPFASCDAGLRRRANEHTSFCAYALLSLKHGFLVHAGTLRTARSRPDSKCLVSITPCPVLTADASFNLFHPFAQKSSA